MTLGLKRRCLTCGTLTDTGSYCPQHGRSPWHAQQHKTERARWVTAVASGTIRCSRCGQPITPGTDWHIDRRPWGYEPSHAYCNAAAGAVHAP
jgi:hypothetical protein